MKPHIKFVQYALIWSCQIRGSNIVGYGTKPSTAYSAWDYQYRKILNIFDEKGPNNVLRLAR